MHEANSFKEAEKFDIAYYSNMPSSKRLEIVQFLRESYFKLKGRARNEHRKGLRRVIKVIK